jgi:hypothetical protein
MNENRVALAAAAVVAMGILASGGAADAQTTVPHRPFLNMPPVAGQAMVSAVEIEHTSTGWDVAIRGNVSSAPPNTTPVFVCIVKVASVQDAATIRSQILAPSTGAVGCEGGRVQINRNSTPQMTTMVIDLTVQSNEIFSVSGGA